MSILFNTNLKKKLLVYSFTHPDDEYYVRELAAIIEADTGNLSRELRKLQDEGLYYSFTRGNLKFYALNKNYPLYNELKEIIFKTEGIKGSLSKIVDSYKEISAAFIYGSYAEGKEGKNSDIDLIIIGKSVNKKFITDIRELERKINREINYTFYKKDEFVQERKKEGAFLNSLLKNGLIFLKGALDD